MRWEGKTGLMFDCRGKQIHFRKKDLEKSRTWKLVSLKLFKVDRCIYGNLIYNEDAYAILWGATVFFSMHTHGGGGNEL